MTSLRYVSEHLNCSEYANDKTSLFRISSLSAGESFPPINENQGVLLYLLSGKIDVILGSSDVSIIAEPKLLFIPKNYMFYGRVVDACEYVTCIAPIGIPLCNRYDFINLRQEEKYSQMPYNENRVGVLAPNDRVTVYFSELVRSLKDGLNCIHYHELKRKELFILLRAYYLNEELYDFFYPLIGMDESFRDFIHHNYKRICSVSEFASLANMSVRNFQRKFKAEFSCSAREWLQSHRINAIRYELHSTQKDLNTIAFENGFSTVAYFSSFCKQYLGDTPSNLRANRIVKSSDK